VRRLSDAGHDQALPTLLEVFEAEAGERAQRRTERLLKYSRLPAGKTFETIERARLPRPGPRQTRRARDGRVPRPRRQRLLLRAARARKKPTPPRRSDTPRCRADTPFSSRPPSGSCRSCSQPSATCRCRGSASGWV
jgi:hypothetical protein